MLTKFRGAYSGPGFVGSVATLVSGTASAQLILVLAAPILTRLYTPEEFGVFSVYLSLLGLLSVISSGRYELAIPLPESDRSAMDVVYLCLSLLLASTTIVAVLSFFYGFDIATILRSPMLKDFIWLLPVSVFLMGLQQIFHYWSIRKKRFGLLSKVKLIQSVVTVSMQTAGSLLIAHGLLLGQIVGQVVGSITLSASPMRRAEFHAPSWRSIRGAIVRYKNFPLYSSWGGWFNAVGQQVPALFFAAFFGIAEAGAYALAQRVLASPMTIVGQAISSVFFANAVELDRRRGLGRAVSLANRYLVVISLPLSLLLIVISPVAFQWIFGANWEEAGYVASWLSIWLFVSFTTSPISMVFNVTENQLLGMVMQLVLLVSRVGGILLGVWAGDFLDAVAGYSVACFIGYFFYLLLAFKVSDAPTSELYRRYLLAGLFICIAFTLRNYYYELHFTYQATLLVSMLIIMCPFYLSCFRRLANDKALDG